MHIHVTALERLIEPVRLAHHRLAQVPGFLQLGHAPGVPGLHSLLHGCAALGVCGEIERRID